MAQILITCDFVIFKPPFSHSEEDSGNLLDTYTANILHDTCGKGTNQEPGTHHRINLESVRLTLYLRLIHTSEGSSTK